MSIDLSPCDGSGAAAQRSAPVAALFPRGALAAELQGDPLSDALAGPCQTDARARARARELLSEAEWRSIAHCSAPRIRDYTAGRLCAHHALRAAGCGDGDLLSAPDRRALWPPGISGSITHTDGYAAAVIAEHARVGSLGLDSERIEDVATALWPQICTPAELEQFAHWPVPERARAVALCFVAKEAFYKAQFAVCAERLGFHDVRIELREAALPGGEFRVHALRALRLQTVRLGRARSAGARDGLEGAGPWTGRFRCHADYVSAGIALPARIE